MDTNLSRKARKDQKLTYNQFLRSSHKLDFCQLSSRIMDVEVLYYHSIILSGYLDTNELLFKNESLIKYPISMMMFGILRFLDYIKFKPNLEIKSKASLLPSTALNTIGLEVSTLSKIIQEKILNIQISTYGDILASLKRLCISVIYLVKSLNLDVNHILYLAIEFYKDVPFFSEAINKETEFRKLEDLRQVFKRKKQEKPTTFIEQYLKNKYDDAMTEQKIELGE